VKPVNIKILWYKAGLRAFTMRNEKMMPRTADEQAVIDRFSDRYQVARSEVLLEIERAVCGCDYGGTSWTTRGEARDVGEMLGLGPGLRLLEVGAGAGWPGLYLATAFGCDVALIDLPLAGLRMARERAAVDRLAGTCWVAAADGAALPFGRGSFDAIIHSDVLCCLPEKAAVLRACRRVVRAGGKMVFSVILVTPDLAAADYDQAVAGGPPFVETAVSYATMLRQAGWVPTENVDLTSAFQSTVGRILEAEEARADEIEAVMGEERTAEQFARRRATLRVLERGLLRRELFGAVPAAAEK